MSLASASPQLQDAAPLFAALGDETRLALIARLGAGEPLSISDLARGSAVSRQAITKHLTVLAAARLVRDRRRGREHLWQLEIDRVDEARRYLDQVAAQWDVALARLKRFVEVDVEVEVEVEVEPGEAG